MESIRSFVDSFVGMGLFSSEYGEKVFHACEDERVVEDVHEVPDVDVQEGDCDFGALLGQKRTA
jgi:hypothetical protein